MYVPPPPIFITEQPEKDPECPHCHKALPGWDEPSDFSFTGREALFSSLIIGLFIANIIGALSGFMNGGFDPCDRLFSRRYHYLIPAYPAACISTRWLTDKKTLFQDENLDK